MAYKFIKYFFDENWYEEVNEEIECEGDTTDYDNDVYSVLMRVKKWDRIEDEIDYNTPGIWVDEKDFPYNFTVIDENLNVVLSYC